MKAKPASLAQSATFTRRGRLAAPSDRQLIPLSLGSVVTDLREPAAPEARAVEVERKLHPRFTFSSLRGRQQLLVARRIHQRIELTRARQLDLDDPAAGVRL